MALCGRLGVKQQIIMIIIGPHCCGFSLIYQPTTRSFFSIYLNLDRYGRRKATAYLLFDGIKSKRRSRYVLIGAKCYSRFASIPGDLQDKSKIYIIAVSGKINGDNSKLPEALRVGKVGLLLQK